MADKINTKPAATWANVSNKPKTQLGDVTVNAASSPIDIDLSALDRMCEIIERKEDASKLLEEMQNMSAKLLESSSYRSSKIVSLEESLVSELKKSNELNEKLHRSMVVFHNDIAVHLADSVEALNEINRSLNLFQAVVRTTLGELELKANIPSQAMTVSIPTIGYALMFLPPIFYCFAVYLINKFV